MKKDGNLIGAGIITAFTASICCITPVLALMAGTSGIASTFSWLEPARPYFIGITILVLGFAWYRKLRQPKGIDCNCELPQKTKFTQTKTFLGIITAFTILMMAFPNYAHIFYPRTQKQVVIVDQSNIHTMEFTISGMTCTGCEAHVDHEVNKLPGILSTTTSYENKNSIVEFDTSKITVEDIVASINSTGYTVTGKNEK